MAIRFRSILFGAVVVAGIGAMAYQMAQPEQVPVDIHALATGPLEVTVNADGMTRIKDVYDVSAPVSGRVLRSPVAIGMLVCAATRAISSTFSGGTGSSNQNGS